MTVPASTADVLNAIARESKTRDALVGRVERQSAVGQLARRITMNQRIAGGLNTTRPTANFVGYGSTKTSANYGVDSWTFEAKPMYVILAFDKYFDQDVEGFTQTLTADLGDAFATAIDREILLNSNGVFTNGVITAASGVSNIYTTTASGLYHDLNKTMGLVEADGYRVNGIVYPLAEASNVRSAISTTGSPIFSLSARDGEPDRLMGVEALETWASFPSPYRFVVGDWSELVWGVYDDLKIEIFDSGSVNINSTEYNLIENNAVAVRAEMRLGFAVRNAAAFAYLRS